MSEEKAMKQTMQLRRGIASGVIAAAIIVAGCGRGSDTDSVSGEPAAAPSPAASPYGDMSADAVDQWATDVSGVRLSTSSFADMSADAASHWTESGGSSGSTTEANYYPHGYDYGAGD
jgi:hypothetical protein